MNESILFYAAGYIDSALIDEHVKRKLSYDAFRRISRTSMIRRLSLISACAVLVLMFCMPWAVRRIDLLTRDWPEFEPPVPVFVDAPSNQYPITKKHIVEMINPQEKESFITAEYQKILLVDTRTTTEYKKEYVREIVDGLEVIKLIPTDEVLRVNVYNYMVVQFRVVEDHFGLIAPDTLISVPLRLTMPATEMEKMLKKCDDYLLKVRPDNEQDSFKTDNNDVSFDNLMCPIGVRWGTLFPIKRGRIDFKKVEGLSYEGEKGYYYNAEGEKELVGQGMPVDVAVKNYKECYEWCKKNPNFKWYIHGDVKGCIVFN